MKLNIIVAVDELGGFGKDGTIPWSVGEDKRKFKEITKGSVCVMGRRTYTDIVDQNKNLKGTSKKLLTGRDSYVVSNRDDFEPVGATKVGSLSEVIAKFKKTDKQIFVLGGFRMFVEVLSYKPTIYMTIIKGNHRDCDVFFPIESLKKYKIVDGTESTYSTFIQYEPI